MIVVAAIELAQAPAEIRIDTFDQRSRRTGYILIDRRTERVDQFDTRGRRLGHGYIAPAPGRDVLGPRDGERSCTDGNGGR